MAKAVTLQVDTDQAQKVLLATNVGKLSLILRHAGEGPPPDVRRLTESDLARTDPVVARAPAAARSDSAALRFDNGRDHPQHEA